jgi:hypothetical protein
MIGNCQTISPVLRKNLLDDASPLLLIDATTDALRLKSSPPDFLSAPVEMRGMPSPLRDTSILKQTTHKTMYCHRS